MPLIEVKLWAGQDDETVGRVIELQTEAMCKAVESFSSSHKLDDKKLARLSTE